jgi:hypothetical protein
LNPLDPLLPRRKKLSRQLVESPNQDFVHTVEDLIDFALTEIKHPLNIILETPAANFSEPDDFSEEEGFNSELAVSGSEDMEDNNDHNEERGNPP